MELNAVTLRGRRVYQVACFFDDVVRCFCCIRRHTPEGRLLWGSSHRQLAPPAGYINKGVPGYNTGPGAATGFDATDAAAAFQSDVVSLHPTIVHIMVGQNDASEAHDADYQLKTPQVIAAMTQMLQAAKAANIKVIIGSVMPGALARGSLARATQSATRLRPTKPVGYIVSAAGSPPEPCHATQAKGRKPRQGGNNE
jgi:hypothetical protein